MKTMITLLLHYSTDKALEAETVTPSVVILFYTVFRFKELKMHQNSCFQSSKTSSKKNHGLVERHQPPNITLLNQNCEF